MTGGTETMLVDIMNEQVKEHDVCCIVINNNVSKSVAANIDTRVQTFYLGRKSKPWDVWPFVKLNRLIYKIKPNVIHVHGDRTSRLILTRRIPIIRTLHSTLGNGRESGRYARICCISEAVRQYSLSQGFDGIVVYNGVKSDNILRKESYKIETSPIHIVQVGRLEKLKGQHLLIEAIRNLKKLGINNLFVDFIGDGSQKEILQKQIKEAELEDRIRLLGIKSRHYIYNHLKDYDLFVQPSLSEGFGLTIAEAMIAGVPVICSNLEGPLEVINYGKYGMSFESGKAKSLAETLQKYSVSPHQIDVKAAQKFALLHFDIKTTVAQYIDIYKSVMHEL